MQLIVMGEFASSLSPDLLKKRVMNRETLYSDLKGSTKVFLFERAYHEMAWLTYVRKNISEVLIPDHMPRKPAELSHNLLQYYVRDKHMSRPPEEVIDALVLSPSWHDVFELAGSITLNVDQLSIAFARIPFATRQQIAEAQVHHVFELGRLDQVRNQLDIIDLAIDRAVETGDSWKDILYDQPDLPVIACDLLEKGIINDMDSEVGIEGVKTTDILPVVPEIGGTSIILQRHAKYVTDESSELLGGLDSENRQKAFGQAEKYFKELFAQIPEDQRQNVDVLFVASNTRYRGKEQRSMKTAEEALYAVQEFLPDENILNKSSRFKGKGVRPTPTITEPNMFTDAPEFVDFLIQKHGDKFWEVYEDDTEQEERLRTKAEGPIDMADRLAKFVRALKRFSRMYHGKHPERRLIVWAVSHYDTISPYVKKYVAGISQETYLPVDYGAGVNILVGKDGQAQTTLQGKTYPVTQAR